MYSNMFYMIGLIKDCVPVFGQCVCAWDPDFVCLWVIEVAYKNPFDWVVMSFASDGLRDKGQAFAAIGM